MLTPRQRKWFKIALREPAYVGRLLKNRLRKTFLFDYRFLKGYSFPPYALSIVPTYRCNLRCKMCNQYEGDYKKGASQITIGEDELSLAQWNTVIADVARWKPHINLFGGEPLLYRDVIELIAAIKSQKLSCSLATNGILLEKYAEPLVQSGIEAVNISIDGPQEINNLIRGTKDAFQRTVRGVQLLQEFKRTYHVSRPRIHLNCVITEWNYARLTEVVELASTLKLDALNFQHLMFSSLELNQANERFFERTFDYNPKLLDSFPVLSTETIDTTKLAAVLETIEQTNSLPIRFLPHISIQDLSCYYKRLDYQFENNICVAPWIRVTISPRGYVTPCIGYAVGNVKEQPFTKIWNSQRYRTFRSTLRKRGLFPGCVRCCHRRYS